MVNKKYNNKAIIFNVKKPNEDYVLFENWLSYLDDVVFFNVINDLIVNGVASIENDVDVVILYEDIVKLDDFEYSILKLPETYPFDIFIDIIGTGLKDLNLKLNFSFQDFAHGNGSGTVLFFDKHRTGAYLKGNNMEYLLSTEQYLLLSKIENINDTIFSKSNDVLKSISGLQNLAVNGRAVLSKILLDTEIVSPNKIKLEIQQIGVDKFRLIPVVEDANNDKLQGKFNLFSNVKPEYNYREDNKKVRVVIDDDGNENGSSIKEELIKLKRKANYNSDEINEIYNSPTKYWDTDLIDMETFGKRVLELGIYKPKFYPFISPYKSQWIPGIVIEDKILGTRHLKIKNEIELQELKNLVTQSTNESKRSVTFKGEELDLAFLPAIIENAERQLKNPKEPITSHTKENNKNDSELKVLIIKENTDNFDYSEKVQVISNIEYNFQKITSLLDGIELKEHQEIGISWLQTLFEKPYSLPGVLLADDMGLGKTLQVLYFIEWLVQKGLDKPILVVAPVSLLENWQNEYVKFFPNHGLSIETLWGSNVRNFIITGDKEQTIKNLNKKALFFTTYETLRKQQIPLAMIDWSVVILDEAQKIKTPGTLITNAAKAIKADFKIAMTGTPVENTLMDLWCIIDFCSPGLLENAKSFASQFQKPLKDEKTDFNEFSISLRGKIGDTLLRRMKIDVAKDLPSITYLKTPEEMPYEQFKIYLNELSEIERLKEEEGNKNGVLQGIFNLRSISDHPYLKHYQLEKISSDKLIQVSAKLKKVISILNEIKEQDEKAIIFTENKSMQRVLRRIISEYFLLNTTIINGETPTGKSKSDKTKLSRQQEIDKYQNKEGFNVIIMSPIAAGFGLNITKANHVIHYTRHWNPAKEQQATDRAYRIGQKKPVMVYYPMAVAPNSQIETFDLVLDNLLGRKSSLASNTLFPTEQIEINKQDFLNTLGGDKFKSNSILLNNLEEFDKLQPLVFEAAIALLLEKKFDGRSFLTPLSNDKGADILFFKEGNNLLVQVKQSSSNLGINSGQEISYAIPEYKSKYNRDFIPQVITNNYFNKNAIDLARKNNVQLFDRDILKKWLSEHPLSMDEIDQKFNDRVKQHFI